MAVLYLGLFVLSTAILMLEVGLTRLFAITQWYHFAFLAVSLALLGFGAGGSLHMAIPRLRRVSSDPERGCSPGLLAGLSACFALACVGVLLIQHVLPIDLYVLAWDRRQLGYLVAEYAALVLPFLVAGLAISLLLEAHPQRAGRLYAANLAGSALGTLLAPLLIGLLGAGRIPLAAGLLAALAGGLFLRCPPPPRRPTAPPSLPWPSLLLLPLTGLLIFLLIRPPSWLQPRIDPHKSLVQLLHFPQAHLRYSAENAISRVDVVAGGPYHAFPGLPLIPPGPLPEQMALTIDGDHPAPLTRFDLQRDDAAFLHAMLTALPYQLHPEADVLLIEPRGGLDLLQALAQGAGRIVVLEPNPLVLEVVTERFAREIGGIFGQAQVERTGVRSYLAHGGDNFDLVVFSLTGARNVVTAGAYSLAEEDQLTVEALADAVDRLRPGGTIVLMRWLQQPPSEELRALTTLVTALEKSGVTDPQRHVVAARGWSTVLLLGRREPFNAAEIAQVEAFCLDYRFDMVWLPGMEPQQANRHNRIREGPIYYDAFRAFLEAGDREGFYRHWPIDVRPARDERPFFFHFFRWRQLPQVLEQIGRTVQPFGGAGFLILPLLLGLSAVTSALLILLPVAIARPRRADGAPDGIVIGAPRWGTLFLYFGALGLGFMGLEIPLLGRFTLFLDEPLYATVVVLFALMVGSGLGSFLGGDRVRWLRPGLGLLVVLAAVYAVGLPPLLHLLLDRSLPWRLLLSSALLLPLGLLMGIPFPAGMGLLGARDRHLIPWAWAVNGCASVLGAIGAQMAALSWGYGAVLLAGAACYGVSWWIVRRLS